MKILIIGATGIIGKIITKALSLQHEVITAGRTIGDVIVDISSPNAIQEMFNTLQQIDACVCVAGDSPTGGLSTLNADNLNLGISNKLLGQIHLVRIGQDYVTDGGSFTLISGKMGDKPARNSAGKAVVNGGINSFVKAAALDMDRGIRINVVSPAKVDDINHQDLVAAYLASITGEGTGEVIKVNYN